MSRIFATALALFFSLNGCSDEPQDLCPKEEGHEEAATPTGAACNDAPLTYDNFGQEFMESYCTRCHSSAKKGEEARHCAPSDHNFDSLDEIVLYREHIDEHSAAGPNGVNDEMPPSGPKPTEQERLDLGTWLACEGERMPQ